MEMSDWYLNTNQLRKICVKIKIKGFIFVGQIWTLWFMKKGIKKWIPIILLWKVLGGVKKKNWYEERKSNGGKCMKVGKLVVFFFSFLFFFTLFPFK